MYNIFSPYICTYIPIIVLDLGYLDGCEDGIVFADDGTVLPGVRLSALSTASGTSLEEAYISNTKNHWRASSSSNTQWLQVRTQIYHILSCYIYVEEFHTLLLLRNIS